MGHVSVIGAGHSVAAPTTSVSVLELVDLGNAQIAEANRSIAWQWVREAKEPAVALGAITPFPGITTLNQALMAWEGIYSTIRPHHYHPDLLAYAFSHMYWTSTRRGQ
jgi:hypothetical protein